MNTAEKLEGLYECSCGKFYSSLEGVAACKANHHGIGKDKFGDRFKFANTVETEYTVVCAECGERLRARCRRMEASIQVDVLPHICQTDPEEYV